MDLFQIEQKVMHGCALLKIIIVTIPYLGNPILSIVHAKKKHIQNMLSNATEISMLTSQVFTVLYTY
jgi:hypothetical protein